MQEKIDALLSMRDAGDYHSEPYHVHKETDREDDDGIIIALVVGIVVLMILIAALVMKMRNSKMQGGSNGRTREGKILVNDSSRSEAKPAGRLSVVDEAAK